MLEGKRVRLVFDPTQGRFDRYGRTLAYLQVQGLGDFGARMITLGAAAEYTYDAGYAHQDRYQSAERNAQAADRGLWRVCGGVNVPKQTSEPPAPATPRPLANAPTGNCTPGYKPCLKPAVDYDCAGGSGDGPQYAVGVITITGSDPYELDADNDGFGCED